MDPPPGLSYRPNWLIETNFVNLLLIIVNGISLWPRGYLDGSRTESPPGGGARPTEPQRRYLERGLAGSGGKLPLFDRDGRQVPRKTVEACIAPGWAEPWTANPIKPDWVVCKLTLVPRIRSSHNICRESDCDLRVQSGTRIIELLVSFDSEVRNGACRKLGRTSESGP